MIRRGAPASGDVCRHLHVKMISDVDKHVASRADRYWALDSFWVQTKSFADTLTPKEIWVSPSIDRDDEKKIVYDCTSIRSQDAREVSGCQTAYRDAPEHMP